MTDFEIDYEDDGYCSACFAELLNGIAFYICEDCGAQFCSNECHEGWHEEGDFQ